MSSAYPQSVTGRRAETWRSPPVPPAKNTNRVLGGVRGGDGGGVSRQGGHGRYTALVGLFRTAPVIRRMRIGAVKPNKSKEDY